jgi:hypothetical protein
MEQFVSGELGSRELGVGRGECETPEGSTMTKKPMTRKTTATKKPATQKTDQREKAEVAPEAFEIIVSKLDDKDHPHRSRRGDR